MPLTELDTLPGKTLHGLFVLGRQIGAGAVSDVYLAQQRTLGNRKVAVKVLKQVLCRSESDGARTHRDRFRYEAELLGMLKSEACAAVFDVGVVESDGLKRPFMVMEYVQGPTLAARVQQEGPIALGEAVRLALVLADALTEMHRFQVLYRDLSPANVMLEEAGAAGCLPRLFDFSHALIAGVQAMDAGDGEQETLAGTPGYAAPELLDGSGDVRADVFSLAALFYFMVTGEVPVAAARHGWQEYVQAAGRSAFPDVPLRRRLRRVPRGLDGVLEKALAPHPDDRYASVAEFARALAEVIVRSAVVSSPENGGLMGVLARSLLRR